MSWFKKEVEDYDFVGRNVKKLDFTKDMEKEDLFDEEENLAVRGNKVVNQALMSAAQQAQLEQLKTKLKDN